MPAPATREAFGALYVLGECPACAAGPYLALYACLWATPRRGWVLFTGWMDRTVGLQ